MAKPQVNCPSCGGLATLAGPQTRCPYCGNVIPSPPSPTQPPVISCHPTSPPIRVGRRWGIVILAAILVLLLSLVPVIFFLHLGERPPSPPAVQGRRAEAVIPLAVDRSGPADILVFNYDREAQRYLLTYLDGLDHSLRWDGPELSSEAYLDGLVVAGTMIYVTDGDRLVAIHRSDGTPAWETRLTDSVLSTSCNHCLQWVGGYVVVLPQDGILQAFAAQTGAPAWSVRLNETPRDLWVVNGLVAVLDRETEAYDSMFLQLRDPATGKVVRKIHAVCTSALVLPIYDPTILVGPDDASLYFFFDEFPGCVQRWDAASGEQAWQAVAKDHYFSSFNRPPILADGTLYAGFEGRLQAWDVDTGAMRVLLDEQDYVVTPLAERDDILVACAERTRGSTRYELWGLEAQTGTIQWKRVMQDEEWLDEEPVWTENSFTWRLTSQGVIVLHLRTKPAQIVVETVDLRSGENLVRVENALEETYPWYSVAWAGDTVWVSVERLYAVDLGTGRVLWTWP